MISSIYVMCQSNNGQNCSEVLEDYNYQVRNQYTRCSYICMLYVTMATNFNQATTKALTSVCSPAKMPFLI